MALFSTDALNSLRGESFAIPPHDYRALTYVGSTNNVETITFKRGGSSGDTVAVITFTYVGGGVANDDNVETIALTQS